MVRKNDKTAIVDATVGNNVESLRLSRGWSRIELGDKIDVTHQQVLKYTNGTNRISAGRLQLIADAFFVPVADLFPASEFVAPKRSRIILELVRGFNDIAPKQQDIIVNLVRAMSCQK